MRNAGLEEAQAGNKIAGRNISNLTQRDGKGRDVERGHIFRNTVSGR